MSALTRPSHEQLVEAGAVPFAMAPYIDLEADYPAAAHAAHTYCRLAQQYRRMGKESEHDRLMKRAWRSLADARRWRGYLNAI